MGVNYLVRDVGHVCEAGLPRSSSSWTTAWSRSPLHTAHQDAKGPVIVANVAKPDNVWMVQTRQSLRFMLFSLAAIFIADSPPGRRDAGCYRPEAAGAQAMTHLVGRSPAVPAGAPLMPPHRRSSGKHGA